MTDRSKTLWTFAITSIALFMVSLDNLVVSTAIPVIRTDLNASLEDLSWTVNAYTLTSPSCSSPEQRSVTASAADACSDRRRHLHRCFGSRRSRTERRSPQHRTGDPGPRRRDRDAADADHPLRRRPAREAWPRARSLGRDRWRRDRSRPGRRRCRRRGLLVAKPSSGSTSRRDPARSARAASPHRDARPGGQARPPRRRPRQRGHVRDRVGLDPRQRAGLDKPGDPHGVGLGFALVAAFVAWELRTPRRCCR